MLFTKQIFTQIAFTISFSNALAASTRCIYFLYEKERLDSSSKVTLSVEEREKLGRRIFSYPKDIIKSDIFSPSIPCK